MHKPTNKRCSCGAIVEVGKRCRQCREHEKLYSKRLWRGTDRKPGLRKLQLMHEPLCEHCLKEGRYTRATEVDHITPHRGNWELFTSFDNLQSLCSTCHARKSNDE